MAAIEGELAQRRVGSGCGKARSPYDRYTSEAGRKPDEGRNDGVGEVGPKADSTSLANQNVLGIADEGGSRSCIAGCRESEEERTRIEAACREATAQERGHGKNDDVVDKECGENSADGNSQREKPQRAARLARNPGRRRVVEAAGTDPRRQDHQTCKQEQGRKVNRARYAIQWYRANGNEQDSDDHRDAGAVDPQSRNAAQRHSKVSEPKKAGNEICHRT